jgi:cation-transporting P-type ATPase E
VTSDALATPGQPSGTGERARGGLTAAQVQRRIAEGAVNDVGAAPTRSVGEIVRANVLTRFNYLIGTLLVIILLVAPIQDALFGLVAISNTLIGIVQELRAKHTLDRLAVVSAARARVVRDGDLQQVPVEELVLDDIVLVGPGEQLAVDATVLEASGLECNEALVTGESDPVPKQAGDDVLSGSFVVAGHGTVRASRVGTASFAGRLTEQARDFSLATSQLRAGIDRILLVVMWVMAPTAVGLLVTQLLQSQDARAALAGSVAGTIAMIPEGLVLLTSVAFAASIIRLGRQDVLVQELPAVEGLARVDVVCFDKTGTLTTGEIRLSSVVRLDDAGPPGAPVEEALGALAHATDPNPTMAAVAEGCPAPVGWTRIREVPFSSARKWSGATFAGRGTWVLGAPEVLLAEAQQSPTVCRRVDEAVADGQRVLLLAHADEPLDGPRLPPGLEPVALLSLSEQLRADAPATIDYLQRQGVRVLLISGDHPATVGAIARDVGLACQARPIAGSQLPDDDADVAALLTHHHVFGRVTPDHKRTLVRGLQRGGHVVAMTGDGVNDVLALKDADVGIAMGNGTSAARNVAQLVLLDNDFSAVPSVVAEGRRVIANVERVANLFLTKTVYATLLAIAVGVAMLPFPFLPRHLSLVGGLTIGIPAFFLALEPNERRARPGFVRRAALFSIPAGTAAAVATFAAFWLAEASPTATLDEARTIATVTLFGLGVIILRLVCRPLNRLRRVLLYAMVALFALAATVPVANEFFALVWPPVVLLLAAIGIIAIASVGMRTTADIIDAALERIRAHRSGGEPTDGPVPSTSARDDESGTHGDAPTAPPWRSPGSRPP